MERRPSRRAGERPGDPGRAHQRRGHRRRDHSRQRTVPRLQHGAGRRAAVRAPGWTRRPRQLRGRRRLRRRAFGRPRRPVPLPRRRAVPDAVEGQPGDDHLQQGHLRGGRTRPRQPTARHVRRVHGDRPDVGGRRRRAGGDLAVAGQPVLPAVVRLLPAVHRPERDSSWSRTDKATFASDDGFAVADFWRGLYDAELVPREAYTGDAFNDGVVGDGHRRTVGDRRLRRQTSTGASCRCRPPRPRRPTRSRRSATRSRSACSPPARTRRRRGTCSSSPRARSRTVPCSRPPGRCRCAPTSSAPTPTTSTANPDYVPFAEQADRTIEVPNVPNSIEVWQTFRDAWSESVIFGDSDPHEALTSARRHDQRARRRLRPGETMADMATAPVTGAGSFDPASARTARPHPAAPAARRLPVRVAVGGLLLRDLRLPARLRRSGCRSTTTSSPPRVPRSTGRSSASTTTGTR